MENLVRSDERLDDLQINGYKIIQHPDKFCFGMDAVLLSSFARVKEGEVALDLGTGTGILPILLEAKTEGAHFTGLEIQPESVEMAGRSVAEKVIEPWEAKAKDQQTVKLNEAIGHVSAAMVCLYPPGAPIIVPGERITEEALELIDAARETKIHVTGIDKDAISVVN